MRTYSISLVFLIFSSLSYAQVNEIRLERKGGLKKSIAKSSSALRFSYSHDILYSQIKATKNGTLFNDIWLKDSYPNGEVGSPNLPAYKKLIRIPKGSKPRIKTVSHSEQLVALKENGINNPVHPNQPSESKNQDSIKTKFEIDRSIYSKNDFSNCPISSIEVLGNLRSATIARVVINPIDYNPGAGLLKIYNDIEVEITFDNAPTPAEEEAFESKLYSPYFDATYKTLDQPSKTAYTSHPDLTKYPVRMLIVCPDSFKTAIKPFIQWKVAKGFKIDTLYRTTETSNEIKTFIQQKYNAATPENPAPSFLVLVGDVELVPASATGYETYKKTDLYYASVDGDMFPDMYYGRLSVINRTQLTNIINKIIYYEKYQFADPAFLNKVTLIAGVDGTGWTSKVGIPTIKYSTANYFNTSKGFTTINEFGVSNDPNNPTSIAGYNNCYNPDRIGVGFINYTAHGGETNWVDPSLGNATIGTLTNINKYPLVIGNCCLTGDFGYPECLGEAWIRAKEKGAVAYIGSSPNSFWYEDFYWAVGAFPIAGSNDGYVPTFQETTTGAYDAPFMSNYVSLGGIVFAGNLAVTEVNIQGFKKTQASSDKYYWEGYNILGDPSLIPYFTEAETNQVNYQPIIVIGVTSFTVNALANSYIAISKNNQLLGTAFVTNTGEVEIPITPITSSGDVSIVITRPQTIPVIGTIQAISPTSAYLLLNSFTINDQSANNNGKADYNESFNTNLLIKNIGIQDATNVKVKITGTDNNIFIVGNDSISIADIPCGAGVNLLNVSSAFSFTVKENILDQHIATFTLKFYSDQGTWTSKLNVTLNSPVLLIDSIKIDDPLPEGNGDHTLNTGETCDALVKVKNIGHALAKDIMLQVSIPEIFQSIASVSNTQTLPFSLDANSSFTLPFQISVIPGLQQEPIIPIILETLVDKPSGLSQTFNNSIQVISNEKVNMSNTTVTTCFTYFMDSGGQDENYNDSENITMTFVAQNAKNGLKISFKEFSTELGYDLLYVFDGPNFSSQQVPGSPFSGSSLPEDIFSNSQYLTFQFKSDGNTVDQGWKATIECMVPQIPSCAIAISPSDGEKLVQSSTLTWTNPEFAAFYDVYIGSSLGSLELAKRVYEPKFTFGPSKNKTYFWQVVPGNVAGSNNSGCSIWQFTTDTISRIVMSTNQVEVDTILFYDSGGPINIYDSNENYTLTLRPKKDGNSITVSFLEFNIENQATCDWDKLTIYNGLTTDSPIIGEYCGTKSPGFIQSSNSSGALTFKFKSDNSGNLEGWKAVVRTIGVNDIPTITRSSIKYFPNPVTNLLTVKSENPIKKLSVFSTLGVLVLSKECSMTKQETISLEKLTPGVYYLIINFENSIPEKGLIIKN